MALYQIISSESAIKQEHVRIWKNAKHMAKEAPLCAVHTYKEQVTDLYTRPDVPVDFLLSRLREIKSNREAFTQTVALKAGLISGMIGSLLYSFIVKIDGTNTTKLMVNIIALALLSLVVGYYIAHISYKDARSQYHKKSFLTYYMLFIRDWEINFLRSLITL